MPGLLWSHKKEAPVTLVVTGFIVESKTLYEMFVIYFVLCLVLVRVWVPQQASAHHPNGENHLFSIHSAYYGEEFCAQSYTTTVEESLLDPSAC